MKFVSVSVSHGLKIPSFQKVLKVSELKAVSLLHLLKRHLLPIQAEFDYSLVLTYALPKNDLEKFLYPSLELDCLQDFGFIAVALVKTRNLRPKGFPKCLGRDFFLSGYRVFTRFHSPQGRRLRGLRILRSDTDSRWMVFLGNLMTHYAYHRVKVAEARVGSLLSLEVESDDGETDLSVTVDLDRQELPESTIFPDFREARKFAGPLPFTFSYEEQTQKMVVVKGLRQDWKPKPVAVKSQRVDFFDTDHFQDLKPRLVNAFYVENIDYSWCRGELM